MKFASAERKCHHFPIYRNKKGFTLLEIFIVLTVLAIVSAISIYYYTDYVEDARRAVRINNVKLLNEALNQYYKDNMSYPKYQWRKDDPSDLSNNKNNGLDEALSRYFVNKTPSQIIKEGSEGKGYKIYYRVTKPRRKNRLEGESDAIPENSLDTGTWKMAKNLRVETFDYLVNEIRIDDSGLETTTFDNLQNFNFPLIVNSLPIDKSSSSYNTIEVDKELDIKMICCPAGTFVMGAPAGELGKKNNENTHNVTITKQFLISKYEITQKQYQLVMGTNPSHFKTSDDIDENEKKYNPVEQVTLDNAKAFCEKLNTEYSRLVPYGYRFDLPTEAQWEYACRAGTYTALNSNKNLTPKANKPTEPDPNCPNLKDVAWFTSNSGKRTHQVGTRAPNAWGLYDMHGNVEELIKDVRPSNYPAYPQEDAIDPLVTVGTQKCHRGGGYITTVDRCRSASRQGSPIASYSPQIGFRVVLVSTE